MDDMMGKPMGSDPQRMPKGGSHTPETENQSMAKPASVKPGFGRNVDAPSKDAMPGFEGLNSYKSVSAPTSGSGYGQGVYPPASKTSQPSIGK
jgi:hypothetical protein